MFLRRRNLKFLLNHSLARATLKIFLSIQSVRFFREVNRESYKITLAEGEEEKKNLIRSTQTGTQQTGISEKQSEPGAFCTT